MFAGKEELDIELLLKKVKNVLRADLLLLEGGGSLNGSFMEKGLIDELSLVLTPIADGAVNTPTLFETNIPCTPQIGAGYFAYIYLVNCVIGASNAFQNPASSVVTGKLLPKEEMGRASGLNSFSGNLIAVFAPVLAAAIYSMGGLTFILAVDFGTFLFAFFVLFFFIKVPEEKQEAKKNSSAFVGCKEGFRFLLAEKGLWYVVVTMSLLNFLSRLTYENILSPMILARSGNDNMALGIVNAAMGAGGIIGGLIVSAGKLPKDRIKTIYGAAGLSFLLGDIIMGLGRNVWFWSFAGMAASLPIPFIMAAQNVILYKKIPQTIQGRVFAVRNALQFGTIPFGILFGGFLAEYIFEPFMQSGNIGAEIFGSIVGNGKGSGMALMFLCTGLTGSIFSFYIRHKKAMDNLRFPEER